MGVKTNLKWHVAPANWDLLPNYETFLIVDELGDWLPAYRTDEEIEVTLLDVDDEREEIEIHFWALPEVPDTLD